MTEANPTVRDYRVRLFYEKRPELPKATILEQLERRIDGILPRDGKRDSQRLDFRHPKFVTNIGGTPVGATWSIKQAEIEYPGDLTPFLPALEQSWRWDGAEAAMENCEHEVLITDGTASNMRPLERLSVMQNFVYAVQQVAPCQAIYWEASQQFLLPSSYPNALEQYAEKPWMVPGAFNIRVLRVIGYGGHRDDDSRDLLIDSLGLGVLGLPDIQCHFRGLDWKEVQQMVYDRALEVFEKGPKLQDGQVVPGLKENSFWKCRFEESLLAPHRMIVDLDPGIPNSAGLRYTVSAGVYVK